MRIIYSPDYTGHCPKAEIWKGKECPHMDTPDRVISICKELEAVFPPQAFEGAYFNPEMWIGKAHSPSLVRFLQQNTLERIVRREEMPDVILESDEAVSLTPGTYQCARASASAALTGASLLAQRLESKAYALCRPSGHHASREKAGGYCFLNNAAMAAMMLRDYGKVFVLDIDLHHGNGTQDILLGMEGFFFFSINAENVYPWIADGRQSCSLREGNVRNINLGPGSTEAAYREIIKEACEEMWRYDFAVVSAGFDTSENDSVEEAERFTLDRECFADLGKSIADACLPTLVVQEGGYNPESVGKDAAAFLKGLSGQQ